MQELSNPHIANCQFVLYQKLPRFWGVSCKGVGNNEGLFLIGGGSTGGSNTSGSVNPADGDGGEVENDLSFRQVIEGRNDYGTFDYYRHSLG